jgi:hypothetical protein
VEFEWASGERRGFPSRGDSATEVGGENKPFRRSTDETQTKEPLSHARMTAPLKEGAVVKLAGFAFVQRSSALVRKSSSHFQGRCPRNEDGGVEKNCRVIVKLWLYGLTYVSALLPSLTWSAKTI